MLPRVPGAHRQRLGEHLPARADRPLPQPPRRPRQSQSSCPRGQPEGPGIPTPPTSQGLCAPARWEQRQRRPARTEWLPQGRLPHRPVQRIAVAELRSLRRSHCSLPRDAREALPVRPAVFCASSQSAQRGTDCSRRYTRSQGGSGVDRLGIESVEVIDHALERLRVVRGVAAPCDGQPSGVIERPPTCCHIGPRFDGWLPVVAARGDRQASDQDRESRGHSQATPSPSRSRPCGSSGPTATGPERSPQSTSGG